MKHRHITMLILVALTLVLLTGCLPGDGTNTPANPAGFLWGIWHGWMAPLSLILSVLVDANYRIYEVYNKGWWYDLGYYMAIISGFGGLSLFRSRRRGGD